MNDPVWGEFDKLGETEVRKLLSMGRWGDQRAKMAKAWLEHQLTSRMCLRDDASLEEIKSANDLARAANSFASSANDIAVRALTASQTNNMIATAALIAAVIAIAVSIIGIFIK